MLSQVNVRCLIVDDNAGFLETARMLLERQGLDVVGVASTGDEAVRLARDLEPGVILLDIDLGGESGFSVARRLVEECGFDGRRLILISTHDEDEFAELIEASPAIGFVSKSDLSAAAITELLRAA
jgi:DNA-binding NarL/FixJ family response regulator